MSKKTKWTGTAGKLTWKFPHIAKDAPQQMEKASKFCEGYKEFLNGGKTERECVRLAVRMLKKAGYKPFDPKASYEPGDKVYYVNREKSVIATTFGKKPLTDGLRINGAHIDSPRLDLKPNPVYEKEDIAYFKTHYYGGIRKYQWGTIPLAMHGVIVKKDGEKVEISIGEKEGDPVFCVTDLLPHLAAKQNDPEAGGGNQGRGAEHRRRFRAVPGRGCEGAGQASGASDFKRNVWDHGARLLPGGDRDGSGPQGRGRGL